MDGDSGSGVEVVVRIDLSQWLEANKLSILDSSKPTVAVNPTADEIAPQRVKTSNPTADPTGAVTF
jgi:hypothetical protein